MIIRKPKRFVDSYETLPDNIKKKAKKAYELLLSNPQHPSLNLKKLKGVENIWYGRIDKNYRFTFRKEGDFLIMRSIGLHNHVIKNP